MHAVNGPGVDPFQVLTTTAVALLPVSYAIGVARLRGVARGRGITRSMVWAFAAGWLLLAGATLSPMHEAAEARFGAHMAQHQILMLLVAPLLVLGRTWWVCSWSLPRDQRRRLGRVLRGSGRVGRGLLRNPLVVWGAAALLFWLWHAPAWFDAARRHAALHALQHLSFLGGAVASWHVALHNRFGRLGYGLAVCWLFATSMYTGVLGVLLTLSPTIWYSAPAGLAPADALQDQQLAGLLMWVPSSVLQAGAALLCFAAWLRAAGRRATV